MENSNSKYEKSRVLLASILFILGLTVLIYASTNILCPEDNICVKAGTINPTEFTTSFSSCTFLVDNNCDFNIHVPISTQGEFDSFLDYASSEECVSVDIDCGEEYGGYGGNNYYDSEGNVLPGVKCSSENVCYVEEQ